MKSNKKNLHKLPSNLDSKERNVFAYNLGFRLGFDALEVRYTSDELRKRFHYSDEEIEEYNAGYFQAIEENKKNN